MDVSLSMKWLLRCHTEELTIMVVLIVANLARVIMIFIHT